MDINIIEFFLIYLKKISTHYDGAGNVDKLGSRTSILILPIISTVIIIGIIISNKNAHIFNYLCTIIKENAFYQYTNATRMLRFLKLVVVVIFGLIVFKIIQNTSGNT